MIAALESWLADLRGVCERLGDRVLGSPAPVAGTEEPYAFRNMYDALKDAEDDEAEQDLGADLGLFESARASAGTVAGTSARTSADARFDEDKDFFFLCTFHDLDEIMHVVQQSWQNYKAERISHLAATVVTGAAIKMAIKADALLQLTYPAVRCGENFLEILKPTLNATGRVVRMAAEAEGKKSTEDLGLDTTIPDFLFMELTMIVNHLESFCTAIPNDDQMLLLREGFFGPVFNEDQNPVREVFVSAKNYICQELPLLYNVWLINERKNPLPDLVLNSGSSLSGQFMCLISQYFRTKTVSLSLAFAVLCWVKSVALIQGGGFLAKTVYLAGDSQRVLQERLKRCMAAGRLAQDDKELAIYVSVLHDAIKTSRPMHLLMVCR
ncbi:hypothetical protein B484DRAFT_467099 [Ochromonadaceae sp. CCMP2298]|nr:hypothetical protein B484DRAFT_467099 [Ochromonadaceae sp. CCMP2298]